MRRMAEARRFIRRSADTGRIATACERGHRDALLAYPVVGANALARGAALAEAHPQVRISVLVENAAQPKLGLDSRLGFSSDVNPGMDRTGIQQDREGGVAFGGARGDECGLRSAACIFKI